MTNAIIVDINLLSLYTINFGFVVYDYLLDEYLNYLVRQFIYLCVFLNQLYQIRCIETGPIIEFERDIGLFQKRCSFLSIIIYLHYLILRPHAF